MKLSIQAVAYIDDARLPDWHHHISTFLQLYVFRLTKHFREHDHMIRVTCNIANGSHLKQ